MGLRHCLRMSNQRPQTGTLKSKEGGIETTQQTIVKRHFLKLTSEKWRTRQGHDEMLSRFCLHFEGDGEWECHPLWQGANLIAWNQWHKRIAINLVTSFCWASRAASPVHSFCKLLPPREYGVELDIKEMRLFL